MGWPGDLGPAFRAEAVLDPKAFAAIRAVRYARVIGRLVPSHGTSIAEQTARRNRDWAISRKNEGMQKNG